MSARRLGWGAVVLVPLLLVGIGRVSLRLGEPHEIVPSTARLTPALLQRVDETLDWKKPASADEALAIAMDLTGDALVPGLGHTTHFDFDVAARSGNCVEYAQLFVALFDRAARHGAVDAKAYAVRSSDPRVLGASVPSRAFRDHDWVMIRAGDRFLYVDPMLSDAWLGQSLSGNVSGAPERLVRPAAR